MKRYYAGIGSRKTPESFLHVAKMLVPIFVRRGYVLRSGGAEGADTFWEIAQDLAGGEKQIYLPWKNFNNNPSNLTYSDENYIFAEKYHPAWHNLSVGGKKLHARNVAQILGQSNNEPVDFVLCWTPDSKQIGGTAQAMRIAIDNNIPIFNFGINGEQVICDLKSHCQKIWTTDIYNK